MDKSNLNKYTVSFGLSLGIASIANALLVIAKESSPSHVMPWMKKVTGHHWSTHCLIVLAIFLLLGWLFSRFNGGKGPRLSANGLILAVAGGVIVGCLTIVGFYVIAG
jgi:membrane-bound metal-dependent hydrolase YbcI (DUF457 family)